MKNFEITINKELDAELTKRLAEVTTSDEIFDIIEEYNSKIISNAPIGANIERCWAVSIYENYNGYQFDIAVITDGTEKVGSKTFSEIYVKASDTTLWYTGKNEGRRHCSPHENRTSVFFLIKENRSSKNWNSIPV